MIFLCFQIISFQKYISKFRYVMIDSTVLRFFCLFFAIELRANFRILMRGKECSIVVKP